MFSLRLQGGIPLSEQLEARIAELIIGGEMAENEKLPAVREVAKALTINPNTVQKTYRQLEQRGLIYSLPGKGSYVAERSQYSSAVLEKATEEFRKAYESDRSAAEQAYVNIFKGHETAGGGRVRTCGIDRYTSAGRGF